MVGLDKKTWGLAREDVACFVKRSNACFVICAEENIPDGNM